MSVSRLVEGVSVHPLPLLTVGAEARSSFILPSILPQWAGRGPGAEEGKDGKSCPRLSGRSFALLCSSGLNWVAGRMNFSGIPSCLTSPGVGVSFLAASQGRVFCHFSHSLQRCCLPQVSKGAALSPQGQGAGSQTWSPAAGDLFWLEVQLCPYF